MTKMKGILKGLRYIAQMFDHTSQGKKERDMQIGLPTDVKHVAHIGWDGPSAAAPSWMNEFKSSSTAELSRTPTKSREARRSTRTKCPPQESSRRNSGTQSSPAHDSQTEVRKPSRRRQSSSASSTAFENVNHQEANVPKQSRRHSSSMASSPIREVSTAEATKKPTRRGHNSSNSTATSPSYDSSGLPPSKHSKKKKTKGSGEGTRRGSSVEEPVMRSSAGAKSLASSLEELQFEGNRAVSVS